MTTVSPVTRLARRGTSEQVADDLRHRILSGEMAPGEALREVTLAQSYGVSRSAVREALKLLSAERFVQRELHRGAFVTELNRADVLDLYRVRTILETAAARDCRNLASGARAALEQAFDRLRSALANAPIAEVTTADLRFHTAIVGTLASPRLDELMEAVANELRFAVALTVALGAKRTDREREREEHKAILLAFLEGQPDAAEQLVVDHLEKNAQRLASLPGVFPNG